MFAVRASVVPFSSTAATVSSPAHTRSMRGAVSSTVKSSAYAQSVRPIHACLVSFRSAYGSSRQHSSAAASGGEQVGVHAAGHARR